MEDLLNSYQRTALKMTLRSFEDSLGYCLSWLGSWGMGSGNNAGRPVSEAERQRALELVSLARQEMTLFAQRMGLAGRGDNPLVTLHAQMTIARANLWDNRSKKLARFGRLGRGNAALAEALDPSMTRLANLAGELAEIFAEHDPREMRRHELDHLSVSSADSEQPGT